MSPRIIPSHREAQFLADVLAELVAAYPDTLFALGHDEASGTVAEDESGNGNDFTIEGSVTLQAGELLDAGQSQEITGADGRIVRDGGDAVATSTGDFSLVHVAQSEQAPQQARFFDAIDPGAALVNRFVFWAGSDGAGELGVYHSGTKKSARVLAQSEPGIWGVSIHGADKAVLYDRGLPFAELALSSDFALASGGTYESVIGNSAANAQEFQGKFGVSLLFDAARSDTEMLDIADRFGAVPAGGHYKTEVIDGLTIAGDLVQHLPTWETAGSQLVDVSGNENHAVTENGAAIGQTPGRSTLLHSVDCSGAAGDRVNGGDHQDLAGTSWTIACDFKHGDTAGNNRGIWAKSPSGERIEGYLHDASNGAFQFDYFDGTNLARVTSADPFDDGAWHGLAVRHDGGTDTLEVYIDGVSVGTADTSAVTVSSTSGRDMRWGGGYLSSNGVQIEACAWFDAVASDADMASLSEAPA